MDSSSPPRHPEIPILSSPPHVDPSPMAQQTLTLILTPALPLVPFSSDHSPNPRPHRRIRELRSGPRDSRRRRTVPGLPRIFDMEKLSDRPHRYSDVDFNDVFGGPPRRPSSFYETGRSRAESLDSLPLRGRGGGSGEGNVGSQRPRSGSGEKQVFGEIGSPARRRHLGDEFFSDIFPGSDSSSSSPRKPDRDSFSSPPGSRVHSPTCPLPPRCEPLVRGSSLPAQHSLAMKLAKGIDHPTFNSPTQCSLPKKDVGSPDALGFSSSPNASMHSLTSRAVPLNDDLRNDAHASYRQSPLSRQISHGLDKSLRTTDSCSLSMEIQSQENPTNFEGYVCSDQFHFSIYKWAGKGVTLILPSNAKEKDSRLRRLPEVVLQGVGLSSYNDDMPTMATDSKSQTEHQNSKFLKDVVMDKIDNSNCTVVEELLPTAFESKSLCSDVTKESDTYDANSKKIPVTMHEGQKELKNLHQLFDEDLDQQGNEDTITQVEETEDFSRSERIFYDDANANQQGRSENSLNHVEVSNSSMQDAKASLENKVRGSRAKGKVKEFIKIFNHEASPRGKGIFDTHRMSRGKNRVKEKVEDQVSTAASKTGEEMKTSTRRSNKSLFDTPTAVNQISKGAENSDTIACSDVHNINDCSLERNCTLDPFAESTPEIIGASVCNIEESHCEDLEGCLVELLSQDQDEHLQSDSHHDQIKISDSKIHEWSKGKEGNIRSLLSTLQYVLWPESGWKPVPLVDIIEGTSVKRAYQKALLCLHPDKLQQKGAALHQKYMAEKVFDILQEAWDHFSSISSF